MVKGLLGWRTGGPPTQLFHDGCLISRPSGLAETINEFFISKVNTLRNKIPIVNSDPLKYLEEAMGNPLCSFKLQMVGQDVVKKSCQGVKELKCNRSRLHRHKNYQIGL